MTPDELRELIELKKKRLYELKKQQAVFGLQVDPSISIEIKTIEVEIQAFETELRYIERGEPPPDSPPPPPAQPPPHELMPEPPFGTMPPNSPFYIEREADDVCWRHISSPYAMTVFIQAPRQVGKSSLMLRMLDRAAKDLKRPYVLIDLQEFPKRHFANEEDFLIELCLITGDALGIQEAIDDYWQQPRANTVKCGLYLTKHVLPKVEQPFILAMDEVDRLFASLFRDNFFGMLRSWHNKRAFDPQFNKMSLFLSSSTEAFDWVDGYDQSPFNVAAYVALQDFSIEEVGELNRRHNLPLDPTQVETLMDLTEGHPFLTRLALYHLVTEVISVDRLFSEAIINSKSFESHMQYYLHHIFDDPEIKQAMLEICRTQRCAENDYFHRLKGAGLIKKVGRRVVPRNRLYARYFEERLRDGD